jgi:integrase
MSAFDVRIHAIRRRLDRRRPFEVRWHAGGRPRSRSFITRGLADSYRAELVRAARRGLDFSPGTGEPASWATPEAATISWLEHAVAYAAMKWPLAAAHTRAGIADALATITPALLTPGRGGPPAAVLRAALYGHAFNPARAGADPGPAATVALAWASRHCLPLTALADLQVTRRALEALALRLDGTRAAATTITRKRAVFCGCLGYAAELGLLAANPLDRITWRPPRSSFAVDPRSTATPAEVRAILAEVTQIRPELTAFFGCLYYAALRPAEAVALQAGSCALPARGWGQLTLTASLPRSARAWTGNGTPREPRGLKHRPEGAIRTVPIPPQLARLLRWHLRAFGCAEDGRLFQGARGGPLSESLYGRIWHQASAAVMPEDGTGAQPVRRPYDLRHAALSLWLASGAPPAEIAARAGHSVRVLLTIYAHCIPGCDQIASQQIEQALRPSRWPPSGPQEPAQAPGIPSVMRPCHSWTQWDTAGPDTSAQIRLHVCELRKCRFERPGPRIAAPDGPPRAPVLHKPLTRPDLAHHWPTTTGNGLQNRSRTRIRPGIREHRHRA